MTINMKGTEGTTITTIESGIVTIRMNGRVVDTCPMNEYDCLMSIVHEAERYAWWKEDISEYFDELDYLA